MSLTATICHPIQPGAPQPARRRGVRRQNRVAPQCDAIALGAGAQRPRAGTRIALHLGGAQPVSLYDLGEQILQKGNYPPELLFRMSRLEEKNGPPRVGNIGLDTTKISNWFAKEFQTSDQ